MLLQPTLRLWMAETYRMDRRRLGLAQSSLFGEDADCVKDNRRDLTWGMLLGSAEAPFFRTLMPDLSLVVEDGGCSLKDCYLSDQVVRSLREDGATRLGDR